MRRRTLTNSEKLAVLHAQRWICACGCEGVIDGSAAVEYDHELALHLGGTNDIENFRALLAPCHRRKTVAEAKARGKVRRIRASDGLTKRRPNQRERIEARRQRWKDMP